MTMGISDPSPLNRSPMAPYGPMNPLNPLSPLHSGGSGGYGGREYGVITPFSPGDNYYGSSIDLRKPCPIIIGKPENCPIGTTSWVVVGVGIDHHPFVVKSYSESDMFLICSSFIFILWLVIFGSLWVLRVREKKGTMNDGKKRINYEYDRAL
jgi:hypothetical protein